MSPQSTLTLRLPLMRPPPYGPIYTGQLANPELKECDSIAAPSAQS